MNTSATSLSLATPKSKQLIYVFVALLAGATTTLGFAPFHLPGVAILSMAILFHQLQLCSRKQAFWIGLAFGLGMMGTGVSWVAVSIHLYGHLPMAAAIGITTVFIVYLSLFPAFCTLSYQTVRWANAPFINGCLFSSLWCLFEYLRAHCLTGFPWLLYGTAQIDTPIKFVLPILGIYGASFFSIFSATALCYTVTRSNRTAFAWLIVFLSVLMAPQGLQFLQEPALSASPITVGVIQANLSMRDKWDEHIFWEICNYYKQSITQLLGKAQVIVLPESAIPLPATYLHEWLSHLQTQARQAHSAVLLGIPEADTRQNDETYYNTIAGLGMAEGSYKKQHLVPFGEYIPATIAPIMRWLQLPLSNMTPGSNQQALLTVHHRPLASLICYELAYPELLRQQLPAAQWIVSLSDDGWFGHSFAQYQHLQMAQVLSMLSHRYQVVTNNSGLSSIINEKGDVTHSLPAHAPGILKGIIYTSHTQTPWTIYGDLPVITVCAIIILLGLIFASSYSRLIQF